MPENISRRWGLHRLGMTLVYSARRSGNQSASRITFHFTFQSYSNSETDFGSTSSGSCSISTSEIHQQTGSLAHSLKSRTRSQAEPSVEHIGTHPRFRSKTSCESFPRNPNRTSRPALPDSASSAGGISRLSPHPGSPRKISFTKRRKPGSDAFRAWQYIATRRGGYASR